MTSLIDQLQRSAMDTSLPLSTVLRQALVVAKKLGLTDFEKWITKEMQGYESVSDVPDYRYVNGSVKVLNPVLGWIPVQFQDPEEAAWLSRMPMTQSISELEGVTTGASRGGTVMISYNAEVEHRLLQGGPMAGAALQVPVTRVSSILHAARDAVLRWALQLEADGITGEGMSFSSDEKRTAQSHNYSVNNFYGSVGVAQIQQHSPGAVQAGRDAHFDPGVLPEVLAILRRAEAELGPSPEGLELRAELDTIDAQVRSPKPKWTVVKEAMASARRIVESAVGKALSGPLSDAVASIDWPSLP